MRTPVLILLLLCVQLAFSQIEQPLRYEVEIGNRDNYYMVQSAEELGLVLFREQIKNAKGGDRIWELRMLGLDLEERWNREIVVNKKFTFSGFDYQNGRLFLMFRKSGNRKTDYYLVRVDLIDGRDQRFDVANLLPIELDNFLIVGNSAVFAGYVNSRVTVFLYDFDTNKVKVLPRLYGKVSNIVDMQVDEANNVFNILITQRDELNDNVMILKSYDQNGEVVTEYTLKTGSRQNIVTGKASNFIDNKVMVTGTYGRSDDIAEGIFFTSFDANGLVDQKYYSFADLKNYYNYLPEKKEQRKEDKAAEKRRKGKELKIRPRMMIDEIVADKGRFVVLGEVYDVLENVPLGASDFFNPYGWNDFNYGYRGYSTARRRRNQFQEVTGFEYSHAVVIVFDEQGNLISDNSMGVEDVESPYLEQVVNMNTVGERITLIYKYEDELRYNVINDNNEIEEYKTAEIKLLHESDELKYNENDFGGLKYWYGGFFYAYGFQKIAVKNMNQSRREVFYVNKIRFN